MRALALALTCCVTLSACDSPVVPIPTSASAGPGVQLMSGYDAGVIFADTCLIRGANFEGALEGLRVHNMTQNASTGTYYHNQANLSVRVTADQCSLVFGTDEPIDKVVSDLADGAVSMTGAAHPRGVDVTSRARSDGLRYFRIGVAAPVQQR